MMPSVETSAQPGPVPTGKAALSIRIRPYRSSDHASVVEMFTAGLLMNASIEGQSVAFWNGFAQSGINGDLSRIDEAYFKAGGHFWVAVCDCDDGQEEVIGMVALERTSEFEGELRRMSVKAEYRRYGVGRMLVETLEAWAAAHGYTRVFLCVSYITQHAHAFYRSLGYALYSDRVLFEEPLFIEGCFEKQLVPVAP